MEATSLTIESCLTRDPTYRICCIRDSSSASGQGPETTVNKARGNVQDCTYQLEGRDWQFYIYEWLKSIE
jgi:hypothetical protein